MFKNPKDKTTIEKVEINNNLEKANANSINNKMKENNIYITKKIANTRSDG